jgi:hypothetical protein
METFMSLSQFSTPKPFHHVNPTPKSNFHHENQVREIQWQAVPVQDSEAEVEPRVPEDEANEEKELLRLEAQSLMTSAWTTTSMFRFCTLFLDI